MLDLRSGRVLRSVVIDHEPLHMAVDTRLHRLFVPSKANRTVSVLDTRDGHLLHPLAGENLDLSPDAIAVDVRAGRLIVATNGDGINADGSIRTFDSQADRATG